MKYLLHDLKETTSIDVTCDYRQYIGHVDDMLDIEPARIQGDLVPSDGRITAHLTVDVRLVLACAKTLKPVPHDLHFTAEIVFGDDLDVDYRLEDPLDLTDVIFGYIVSEKPYNVYHPDAKDVSFDQEKKPHPAFADLEKFIKG